MNSTLTLNNGVWFLTSLQTSFGNAVKSKARLSIKGEPERQTTAVGSPDIAANMSMSTVLCSHLSVLMMITNGKLYRFLAHLSGHFLLVLHLIPKKYLKVSVASLFHDNRTTYLQLNFQVCDT